MKWIHGILPPQLAAMDKRARIQVGEKSFHFHKLNLVYHASHAIGPCVIDDGIRRATLSMGPRFGHCRFNNVVYVPKITEDGEVWMSLTPFEILTQRPGLKKARGNVLVGGLGMGWFAKRCCERKQVTSVTVIEKDPSIVEHFKFEHPKLKKIVCSDVWLADFSKYDSILLDIWKSYGWAEGTKELLDLKAKYKNVWAWGDVQLPEGRGLW